MRTLALFVFTCAAGIVLAQTPDAAVMKAELAWSTAIAAQDYATLEKVLGDDIVYTHSNGRVDNKRSYIDDLKAGKSRYFAAKPVDVKVRMLGKDTALTTQHIDVVTLGDGKQIPAKLTVLHVFQLRNGQWQMVAHQSARIP